jgi:hypothetical protein
MPSHAVNERAVNRYMPLADVRIVIVFEEQGERRDLIFLTLEED